MYFAPIFINGVEPKEIVASFSPFILNLIDSKKILNIQPNSIQSGYSVNSYGYRSDEFIENHEGKHVLFAGCSVTWGVGLEENEIWSKIVYERISSKEKYSGYFSLGFPGTCVTNQVYDIFEYCNKYGNPDSIFYCLPDFNRGFDPDAISPIKKTYFPPFYTKYEDIIDKENKSKYTVSFTEMINSLSYFSLYQYCKSNNIKLYSFSWQEVVDLESYIKKVPFKERSRRMKATDGSNIKQSQYGVPNNPFESFGPIKNLETFYIWNREELIDYCSKFISNYSGENKDFLQVARDGNHMGIAPHSFWADFILKKYYLENSTTNML